MVGLQLGEVIHGLESVGQASITACRSAGNLIACESICEPGGFCVNKDGLWIPGSNSSPATKIDQSAPDAGRVDRASHVPAVVGGFLKNHESGATSTTVWNI